MRVIPIVLLSLAAAPAIATTPCTDERFVFGNHNFPSHAEALEQCRKVEQEMTDADTGAYERAASCLDVGETGQHEGWTYGRVALDVVARESGEPYTFEGLWMCKPIEN